MSVVSDIEGEPHGHVAPGETGIFSRRGFIPVGYYNDPVKTAKTFVDVDGEIWLLLGDEARLEEDNSITVYGRGSNCINSGGEKIYPEEVEQALKANPGILDALVVATPDEKFGSKVTAVIATRGDARLSLEAVRDHARDYIAGYKLPRELHVIDEVPRAPSGKPAYAQALEIALAGEHLTA
jgi:acyl-CoA synthetase (AMP-forming)/AMP-acid ligase II